MRPKKFTRAGFRPDKTDLKPERADWRLGKANLRLERAVLRPGCRFEACEVIVEVS